MRYIAKGIAEGNIIRLEEAIQLPRGTQVVVSCSAVCRDEQETIKQRQRQLLERGFYLGKKFYNNREELHDREAD